MLSSGKQIVKRVSVLTFGAYLFPRTKYFLKGRYVEIVAYRQLKMVEATFIWVVIYFHVRIFVDKLQMMLFKLWKVKDFL